MSELQLTDAGFEKDVVQSAEPVLVDFWAPWCGPCRMLAPVIEELAKEYEGKIKVGKMNTDEQQNTAGRYQISAIPTLLFFKGGKVVEQLVGMHSKAEIKKTLENLISVPQS
jgi:thioredoxin 1